MRLFIERFAIPVLAAALMAVVVNQLTLSPQVRLPFIVGIIGVAVLIAFLAEERRAKKDGKPHSANILVPMAVMLSLAAIGIVIYLVKPRAAENVGSMHQPEGQRNPPPRVSPTQNTEDGTSTPAAKQPQAGDDLFQYIEVAPRSGGSAASWPVLMYGENGDAFPVLRASGEAALQERGKSTPPIFRNPIPSEAYDHLFAADITTLAKLRRFCDGLVLGKVKTVTLPSDQFSGMYTTHLSVDVKLASTSDNLRREFKIDESGAGFDAEDSKSKAEERLAQKLRIEISKALAN